MPPINSPSYLGPAFLPNVTLAPAVNRGLPTQLCKTQRPQAIQASASTPLNADNNAGKPLQQKLAKAAFVAVTASMLAVGMPTSLDDLLNPSVETIPQHVIPSAYATGRGGGASFTSASGDVIKDPEALLRWSLPIDNKTVRSLQQELELAVSELRGLKWSNVDSHVKKATLLLNKQSEKVLSSVPADQQDQAATLLQRIRETIDNSIEPAVQSKNPDKLTKFCRDALRDVGSIEQAMVTKFPFEVPSEFNGLPQLQGRATVEMVVRKGGDEQFDINGTFFKEGTLKLVLDGYSAPVSAGNFIDLVNKGFYNGIDILRSDGFIVQSGKPKSGDGYSDSSGTLRTIPLEIFAKGDQTPIYGITLEEDGRGAASTVLPFTSYGTLAVARVESEANSASSQFFWFLFEPDLTPAGRNLMDGNWAVMGYTTSGEEYLRSVQKGDEIVSAKVIDGLDNLKKSS